MIADTSLGVINLIGVNSVETIASSIVQRPPSDWADVGKKHVALVVFGFSALAGAVLFHFNDPLDTVKNLLVASIAKQCYVVFSLKRPPAIRTLLPYITGGIAGLLPGLVILFRAPPNLIVVVVGWLAFAYGFYSH